MDFSNEKDCKNVFFKRVIEIDGQQMLLEQWTQDFKPDEDSPFASVWVLLPGFPFYCHYLEYIKQNLSPVGVPQTSDIATGSKIRSGMEIFRVLLISQNHYWTVYLWVKKMRNCP